MKIGLLAYSSKTGLGYQTRDFAKHMNPSKVLVADLSRLNGMPVDHSWAGGYEHKIDRCESPNYLDKKNVEWLVDGMDVVFVCETPLNHYLFEYARRMGKKSVQQYNWEFLDYHRDRNKPAPDILAAPSYWKLREMRAMDIAKVVHWPVPIDLDLFPLRAEPSEEFTFVHVIGRPAAYDRNGTLEFLEAFNRLPEEYGARVFVQPPTDPRARTHYKEVEHALNRIKRSNFQIIENEPDNTKMYAAGHVQVLPRRYGGLCIPMWESLASGMPVIMTDVSPNDMELPPDWLVPATHKGDFMAMTKIDLYSADAMRLAACMLDSVYHHERDRKEARQLAEARSWQSLKKHYLAELETLCE